MARVCVLNDVWEKGKKTGRVTRLKTIAAIASHSQNIFLFSYYFVLHLLLGCDVCRYDNVQAREHLGTTKILRVDVV